MKATEKTSVLICGAGPVGMGLALALKRCGVDSIVIEKKRALDEHSRALALSPRTLEIFRAWNCLDSFLAAGEKLRRAQLWSVGKNTPRATIDLKPLEKFCAFPELLILPQDRTEHLLSQQALEAGCDVRFAHELGSFSQDENGVAARVKCDDGEYSIDAKFLVGCDGAHSRVREILGWKLEGKTYAARVLICDLALRDARDKLPWPRVAPLKNSSLIALRYAPQKWRIIHTLQENQSDEIALSESYIASLSQKLFGAGHLEIIWSSVFRIHRRHSARWVENRVALCGDACHLNSPAGGQGMNSGLHDAHNLAWKLAAILNGKNSGGADARVLLSSYQTERKGEIQTGVERYTDLLTRFVLLGSPARRGAFLLAASVALRVPFLREKWLLRATMLDTKYQHSPILKGASTLLGKRAPDGEIFCDGKTRRLLDCVFPHALLILFDDGKLPRWNEAEIRAQVENIAPVEVRVLRLNACDVKEETAWRDANGTIFRAWKITEATAALIRPDGHIGWLAARPSREDLKIGVKTALGAA